MNPPVCGATNPLRQAILEIASTGLNETKFRAATDYAEDQIEPYATSISDDISSIIFTNFLTLLFIVLIVVIAAVLWICATLQVEGYIVAIILLILLLAALAATVAFDRYASAAVARTLDAATVSASRQLTSGLLISTLSGAAQEYLDEIGISC